MSISAAALLVYATWTILILSSTVGVYRWSRILSGRASVSEWHADESQGSEWYRRAMRAHMNCVENLPVFTAIVVAAWSVRMESVAFDALAIATVSARIVQSLVHVSVEQTELIASIRFLFFFIQGICMLAMVAVIALVTVP
jgi:uncharacterized MAPEG superfamily protein